MNDDVSGQRRWVGGIRNSGGRKNEGGTNPSEQSNREREKMVKNHLQE